MKHLLVAAIACFSLNAFAGKITELKDGKATKDITIAHAEKVFKLIQDKGEKAAFDLLSDPNGDWINGDLYAFVLDDDGVEVAHPKLRGKNVSQVNDPKGKAIFPALLGAANSDAGKGWAMFYWSKLSSTAPSKKYTYVIRPKGKKFFICVGTYDVDEKEMEGEKVH